MVKRNGRSTLCCTHSLYAITAPSSGKSNGTAILATPRQLTISTHRGGEWFSHAATQSSAFGRSTNIESAKSLARDLSVSRFQISKSAAFVAKLQDTSQGISFGKRAT